MKRRELKNKEKDRRKWINGKKIRWEKSEWKKKEKWEKDGRENKKNRYYKKERIKER